MTDREPFFLDTYEGGYAAFKEEFYRLNMPEKFRLLTVKLGREVYAQRNLEWEKECFGEPAPQNEYPWGDLGSL